MSVSANFTLHLSAEGNSVEINRFEIDRATIPEQLEASTCKTHEQVLAFLEKINGSTVKDSLSFYHTNYTLYDEHVGSWPTGTAHLCPLEKQIDFLRCIIEEQAYGLLHNDLYS